VTRWLTLAPLVVLLALAALFGLYALRHDPRVQPHALVGKPTPDVVLPALEGGEPVRLAALAADGPVVINFFASWCAPCQVEHPVLMGLRGQPVRVIGVAYKDAPEKTEAFLARLGDPFAQVLVDRDGRAGVEFGVTGVPETYVVAKGGRIVAKHTGPLTPNKARALIRQAG
jgi:cytochrome c biogenesis protein CcmG/thiol:disulfide interchange protein DsbE